MDLKELYAAKLTGVRELAARVENGWLLGMDNGPTQTDGIMAAICERAKNGDLKDVKVHTMLDVYPFAFYADNALDGKVNGVSWFSSGGARKAVAGGYADSGVLDTIEVFRIITAIRSSSSVKTMNTTRSAFPFPRWISTATSALPLRVPIPKA